jgi:hypothetical protein
LEELMTYLPVRSLCHILELDKELSEEVTRLRKGLLKLVGVQEFSTQAALSSASRVRQFSSMNVVNFNPVCFEVFLALERDVHVLWQHARHGPPQGPQPHTGSALALRDL